jgi:hypothetical protein
MLAIHSHEMETYLCETAHVLYNLEHVLKGPRRGHPASSSQVDITDILEAHPYRIALKATTTECCSRILRFNSGRVFRCDGDDFRHRSFGTAPSEGKKEKAKVAETPQRTERADQELVIRVREVQDQSSPSYHSSDQSIIALVSRPCQPVLSIRALASLQTHLSTHILSHNPTQI